MFTRTRQICVRFFFFWISIFRWSKLIRSHVFVDRSICSHYHKIDRWPIEAAIVCTKTISKQQCGALEKAREDKKITVIRNWRRRPHLFALLVSPRTRREKKTRRNRIHESDSAETPMGSKTYKWVRVSVVIFLSFPNIYSANRCARYFLFPSIFFPIPFVFSAYLLELEVSQNTIPIELDSFFIYDYRRMRHCHSELIIIAFLWFPKTQIIYHQLF